MNLVSIIIILLFSIPIFIYIFSQPKILTIIVVFFSVFQFNWFIRYWGAPRFLNYLVLYAGAVLAFRIILDISLKTKKILLSHQILITVSKLAIYVFVLTIISAVYNGENIFFSIFNLRYYFHSFVLMFAVVFYFRKELTIEKFKKWMILLGLIQIPFAVLQFLSAGGYGQDVRTLDSVAGTFASYGDLVASQILSIGILLFEKFRYRRHLFSVNSYFLAILLTVPLLISKSRTASAFIPAIVLFSWIASVLTKGGMSSFTRGLIPMTILILASVFLFYTYFWKTSYDVDRQLSYEFAKNYFTKSSERLTTRGGIIWRPMGRLQAIATATSLVTEKPITAIIGFGAGAVSDSHFLGTSGKYYQQYGPLAGLNANEYSKVIMEFGFLSFWVVGAFFVAIYRRLRRLTLTYTGLYVIILFSVLSLSWYTQTLSRYFLSLVFTIFLGISQIKLSKDI